MKLTEREKAYHDGYEQGRFDEYAERMGYDQAEKVKAKIDKQKNCPYCHVGSRIESFYNGSPWDDTELSFDRVDDDVVSVGNDTWGEINFDPVNRTLTSWGEGTDPLIVKINYCPICGRSLSDEND